MAVKHTRQAAVFALADRAVPRREIAQRLAISLGSVDHYLDIYRAERTSPNSSDATVPKFAHHAECVSAVMAHGGFPRLAEQPNGRVCLPLIYPGRAA